MLGFSMFVPTCLTLAAETDPLAARKPDFDPSGADYTYLLSNVDPRLGLVNLPFLFDSLEKLNRFRDNEQLFAEFGAGTERPGWKEFRWHRL